MAVGQPALPPGHRFVRFDTVDSTNAEALRLAEAGERGPLWVWAHAQTAGRGRSGRPWHSPAGNLYASLLLRPSCPLETAPQLALVAAVAAHDAVIALGNGRLAQALAIKWPNDLLLAGDKVGGILLESAQPTDIAVVIGTGLNLVAHPGDAIRPATDLASHGISAAPAAALACLARATAAWLAVWDEGRGFETVRAAWEARAVPPGHRLRVRLDGREEEGIYGGIDAQGALRFVRAGGEVARVTAGDVFLT